MDAWGLTLYEGYGIFGHKVKGTGRSSPDNLT